jgi:hypothetical protein
VQAAFVPYPQDQTFHPVQPCRIVDTRVAGGKLASGATRNFAVSGTTGFLAQGGKSGGCGIPATATAVAMSVIAVHSASSSDLTVWPAGIAIPLASVLNYQKGQNTNTGVTVPISPNANPALSVRARYGPLDLVIDVSGYYEPQTHAIILASGQVWYGNSTHMTQLIHSAGTGIYTMIFDRSLTGCDVLAVDNGDQTVRAAPSWGGTSLTVNTYALVGSTLTHEDESFQFFITC